MLLCRHVTICQGVCGAGFSSETTNFNFSRRTVPSCERRRACFAECPPARVLTTVSRPAVVIPFCFNSLPIVASSDSERFSGPAGGGPQVWLIRELVGPTASTTHGSGADCSGCAGGDVFPGLFWVGNGAAAGVHHQGTSRLCSEILPSIGWLKSLLRLNHGLIG